MLGIVKSFTYLPILTDDLEDVMWKYERLKIDWDTGIYSVTSELDKPSLEFIPTAVKKTELKILA